MLHFRSRTHCPTQCRRLLVPLSLITAGVILATACRPTHTIVDLKEKVSNSGVASVSPISLSQTVDYLAQQAAALEDNKDVKCWTSFKLLETFIAGRPLTPESTHIKTEVVLNYLDQIWRKADAAATTGSIDDETFRQVARQCVPWDTDALLEYVVSFPQRVVRIRYQDVENYQNTVEPIRQMQSLSARLIEGDPVRKGLTENAIHEATHVAALLSALVLHEANTVRRDGSAASASSDKQEHHLTGADILEADRRICRALRLLPLDPAHTLTSPGPNTTLSNESHESLSLNVHDKMMSVVRQKIQSLEKFNTTYSRDKLHETFDANLAMHETEWAKLPIDPPAAAAYKKSDLVDLAEFLYENCARRYPDNDPLTGSQMLSTIQTTYPFVTHFEHGTIHLYPNQPQIQGLKVEEYEADAFRDSAWHWRALELMLQRTADKPLPAMDLYALEELSEFVSVFSVAYVKLAGQLIRSGVNSSVSTIDRTAFKSARQLFVIASAEHLRNLSTRELGNTNPGEVASPHIGVDSVSAPERQDAASHGLKVAYIEQPFTDVTSTSGIDFRHESSPLVEQHRFAVHGARPQDIAGYVVRAKHLRDNGYKSSIPNHSLGIEGGGVAVADVDGDGLLDIYLVSGLADRLYRNQGALRFADVTEQANLGSTATQTSDDHAAAEQPSDSVTTEGRGAYFVDFDNDGDQDLFVTNVYAPNRLLQNNGQGVFTDVTEVVGLPLRTDMVSHSAVWFDMDNDGWLDVYIVNYGDWLGNELPLVQANSRNGQANQLFRNDGQGRFEDVTSAAGAGDTGWAQAVSHFDVNRDGWQDIYVANDFGQDLILLNENGQRFTSQVVGEGKFLHGMSVGFTDVNDDDAEDVYVSNISTFSFASKYIMPNAETRIAVSQRTTAGMRMMENNLFMVSGKAGYEEMHDAYFDRSREGDGWAWDADFFDFDNDGKEDLYVANGREPNLSYAFERNVLHKQVAGHFYDVSANSGADIPSNTRGVAHGDFDGDGDLDLVTNNYKDGAVVLRNNLQRHNWIKIRLQGSVSNRDAIGARVTIQTESGKQIRTVRGGSGFLSKEDTTVHFGLGELPHVANIEVVWPSRRRQSISGLAINREHTIVEPKVGDSARQDLR